MCDACASCRVTDDRQQRSGPEKMVLTRVSHRHSSVSQLAKSVESAEYATGVHSTALSLERDGHTCGRSSVFNGKPQNKASVNIACKAASMTMRSKEDKRDKLHASPLLAACVGIFAQKTRVSVAKSDVHAVYNEYKWWMGYVPPPLTWMP
jgi:hypothetical protein